MNKAWKRIGNTFDGSALEVMDAFAKKLGGVRPEYSIKKRPDGQFLLIEFVEPNERFFELLNDCLLALPEDHCFRNRCAIIKRKNKPKNILTTAETKILQRELSESLTVDRHTFGEDFFSRYTASVTDLEHQIVARANFIVYGRRGSGKSSLLAYAMHSIRVKNEPFAWIALQPYARRTDYAVISGVLSEVLRELEPWDATEDLQKIALMLEDLVESSDLVIRRRVERLIPRIRVLLGKITNRDRPATVFLDDLHVVDGMIQPELLKCLYGICRGNNSYLKISGIEQLTRLWDTNRKIGLETPHDAQILT